MGQSACRLSSLRAPLQLAVVTVALSVVGMHQLSLSHSIATVEDAGHGVVQLADQSRQQIKTAQQPEITTMTGWLTAWGSPPMPSMTGMKMNGGMSAEEMENLEAADGATAQKLFLEGMIKHHQGAIQMAQTEMSNGKNPDAIALAKNIASSQQEEIATMNELLSNL